MPGETTHEAFNNLPHRLYTSDSPRFQLGNEPVSTHLTGCYVLWQNEVPVGRFAFYENPGLQYQHSLAACIGSYECKNDPAVSRQLIEEAIALAKSKGYSWLIGPMEGSTWNNYRFSTHHQQVPFFMEPYHHLYYNDQFIQAGFKPIANYYSNLDQSLEYDAQALAQAKKGYEDEGAVFRSIDMENFEDDLKKIGQLSINGFAENFLYTPISVDEFVSKYARLKQFFDPKLITIVEDAKGELQALSFNLKNFNDPSGKSMIVKSLMRSKSCIFKGVGSYLVGKTTQTAKEMGFEQIIHAFIIRGNASQNISEKYSANEYKSYALYGLKL
ncbi:hypothetical protein [uncultured Microscilla sp.]|uniref:hypothetical protein n=1 Tax=uncultured Microscilla sp. TaxID=432653 RepID=UPI00263A263D|nr:hypothetical protein [uncultured Microscilla sp.]